MGFGIACGCHLRSLSSLDPTCIPKGLRTSSLRNRVPKSMKGASSISMYQNPACNLQEALSWYMSLSSLSQVRRQVIVGKLQKKALQRGHSHHVGLLAKRGLGQANLVGGFKTYEGPIRNYYALLESIIHRLPKP